MARERGVVNVKCSWCGRKDTVKGISEKDRKRILYPEYGTEKKQPWWDWRVAVHPKQEEVQQDSM